MNESDRTNPPGGWQGHGPDSIEERRRILRSLGAGGAIAGLPTLAHATGRPHCKKDSKNYHPTASAVGSMIGSVSGTTLPMYGHPCSYYQDSAKWGTWTAGGVTLNWDRCGRTDYTGLDRLRFWQAMGLSSAPGVSGDPRRRWCSTVLHSYPGSDEGVWLSALCNAHHVGARFPYTATGVRALYVNQNPLLGGATDATLHSKAIVLFRDYLSMGEPA